MGAGQAAAEVGNKIVSVSGATIGAASAGALLSFLLHKFRKNKNIDANKVNKHEQSGLYRAMEAPGVDEDEAIDDFLDKHSSIISASTPLLAAALPILLMMKSDVIDVSGQEELKAHYKKIKQLKTQVDAEYRKDLLSAYDVDDEQHLAELKGSLVKESSAAAAVNNPRSIEIISAIIAGLTGFTGYQLGVNATVDADPDTKKKKEYWKKYLNRYKQKENTLTIGSSPFSTDELLALRLHRQGGLKKVKSDIEENTPIATEATSEDLQQLLKDI